MWQVKSSNDSGSSGGGGEIPKIKLCILRPPESSEPSPRKRKRYEIRICMCVYIQKQNPHQVNIS